jgi:O-antigen/teichoic acid export membrane protein
LGYIKRIRELLTSGYDQSIIRRTTILGALILPAFAANFLVYYFLEKLLSAERFGLFYVAVTIGNILYSGSNIFNVFFTRHLTQVERSTGELSIFPATLALERSVILYGALISAAALVVLILVANYIGLNSNLIIFLIVLDTYVAYVSDLGRVLLQSMRRTIWLGSYTLIWMITRLVFCVAGAAIFGTVTAALAGSILSTVVVFAAFHIWLKQSARRSPAVQTDRLRIFTLVPTIAGYGMLILLSNLDVLFSYLLLGNVDIGLYSASSVFPKAILVVITPLQQMLLPMMVPDKANSSQFNLIIAKIGGIVLLLTSVGIGMLWLLSGAVCGGRWGLTLCQPATLHVLLLSALPLVLLRVLVSIQYARGRDMLMLWLALPSAAYLFIVANSARTIESLAQGFAVFSAGTCLFFLAICVLADHVLRNRAA